MEYSDISLISLSMFTGYLLGSFLPGYFLPLWLKKVDIRKLGDGNPGATNVKRNVGTRLAFLTAFIDVLKGLLSVSVIAYIFKLPLSYAYLAGFSAILGHKFPFYLGCKGGRGFATTIGLFIFMFIKILVQQFSLQDIIPFFVCIAALALLVNLATHGKGDFFTFIIFPFIGTFMLFNLHVLLDLIFILALISIITIEAGRNLIRDKIKLSAENESSWRTLIRPFALLIIPLGIYLPRFLFLLVIGCVLAIFFFLDLSRILLPKVERYFKAEDTNRIKVYKNKEVGKISSMTCFLAGIFICFILFDKNIAFACLGFVSIADMFGKLVGINAGKTRIFKRSNKTFEGSLAFLSIALAIAFFLWSAGLLPLHVVLIGAVVAAIVEALPTRVDDNLTISVISGAIMTLLYKLI
jgi:acyl phosphate:glycerol-3-phosphate acyltransferase